VVSSDAVKEITRLRATIAATKAIDDRPLDDDLNVLWGRCEDKEPLSIAEQRELYAWLQEKDGIMGELDEKVDTLNAIVEPLTAVLKLAGGMRIDEASLDRKLPGYRVAGLFLDNSQKAKSFNSGIKPTLPEALAAAEKAAGANNESK
jgi:hypothetical protein